LPYLIDGHNLIAALPDVSLADVEDERQLLEKLNSFCTRTRRKVLVFFDQGQIENEPFRSGHFLRAVFIHSPRTADDAIRAELRKLGRSAANWTVISSDREVKQAARAAGARTLDSQAFVDILQPVNDEGEPEKSETTLSDDELEQWLHLFKSDND